MVLPVWIIQIGVGDGIAAMQHHVIAHVNSAMGHAVRVWSLVGVLEENQITGLGVDW